MLKNVRFKNNLITNVNKTSNYLTQTSHQKHMYNKTTNTLKNLIILKIFLLDVEIISIFC